SLPTSASSSALGKMSCAAVYPAVWVMHGMRQLVFDVVGAETKHLIQNHTSHGAEPVTGHRFGVKTHLPQGSIDGVIAHRPTFSMKARKYE
ncbi:hypothetical protein, partial [Xanthomonas hortorum]|uniref:hypothetical protein n=1 Tax=Xanthomonas hortorum TaxID=56454 RepID=UPI0028C59F57